MPIHLWMLYKYGKRIRRRQMKEYIWQVETVSLGDDWNELTITISPFCSISATFRVCRSIDFVYFKGCHSNSILKLSVPGERGKAKQRSAKIFWRSKGRGVEATSICIRNWTSTKSLRKASETQNSYFKNFGMLWYLSEPFQRL